MVKLSKNNESATKLMEALKSEDENKIKQAWENFNNSIYERLKEEFDEYKEENDKVILAQRGFRQLTSKEITFYEKFIKTAKSSNPKQAFTTLLTDNPESMPETIIEDVYKDLKEEHPLLSKIKFQNVKYLTTWLLSDYAAQKAIWGEITEEIKKEITSAFKTIDTTQFKLSAFAVIEKGMLDLGPVFIDAYIRECLKEALALGLEDGIINGNGKNAPIGMRKNIKKNVTISNETGYPDKEKIKVTDFTPLSYGQLLGKITKKENGKRRKFGEVTLICNQMDYLTKIMPATTVLNAVGEYKRDLFPFPTDVIVSNVLEDGEAILVLPEEYFLGVGGEKDGVIEYTDEYKFIEDQRVYKIKQYATGRCEDNTTALLLDITEIDPAYITIENKTPINVTVNNDKEVTA